MCTGNGLEWLSGCVVLVAAVRMQVLLRAGQLALVAGRGMEIVFEIWD